MKLKPVASQPLTKEDLVETLRDFRKDIDKQFDKIDSRFGQIDKRFNSMQTRFDIKLDELELRIEDRARERHSQILTRFDQWAGALEKADQDRTVSTAQISELQADVRDIKKRVKKLEAVRN